MALAPGQVRDAIISCLAGRGTEASTAEIEASVIAKLGPVPKSSIRSYLNNNVPALFLRTARGRFVLAYGDVALPAPGEDVSPTLREGQAELFRADCLEWLQKLESASIHAVVTDPPYGLSEYSAKEQAKLRSGKGGVWRIPPSFDGHKRSPLPRFTVLDEADLLRLRAFFRRLAVSLSRVIVPGGNVIVASNPLLAHIVTAAMVDGGLEPRGTIVRLTMTMRGGDRPKNAHIEFDGVSVMPRSMWEPWIVLRRPLDGRVQDNLRRWGTGGFRRPSATRPFGDVIRSNPASKAERAIAPHPSLKPQHFLRQLVAASLPLGRGLVLDPFAGSGSTLAAANAVGYASVGVESDPEYVRLAQTAIRRLAALKCIDHSRPQLDGAFPIERRRSQDRWP